MTTDNDLLELLETNPSVGFQELLSRHGSKLYRAASKLMRDKAEIEDILQDSLIAVLKNIHTFNAKGELLAWLYRSAAATANLSVELFARGPLFIYQCGTATNDLSSQREALSANVFGW